MRAGPAVTPPKGKAARQQKYAHRPITGAPDKTAACRAKPLPAADKPKNQNRARPPQRPCRRQAASTVAHRNTLAAIDSVVSTTTLKHHPLPQASSVIRGSSQRPSRRQRCVNHNPKAPPLAARQRCHRPLPMLLPSGQNFPNFFRLPARRPYQPSIPGVAGAVLWRNTSCALS